MSPHFLILGFLHALNSSPPASSYISLRFLLDFYYNYFKLHQPAAIFSIEKTYITLYCTSVRFLYPLVSIFPLIVTGHDFLFCILRLINSYWFTIYSVSINPPHLIFFWIHVNCECTAMQLVFYLGKKCRLCNIPARKYLILPTSYICSFCKWSLPALALNHLMILKI